jgi:hypothetical protein
MPANKFAPEGKFTLFTMEGTPLGWKGPSGSFQLDKTARGYTVSVLGFSSV